MPRANDTLRLAWRKYRDVVIIVCLAFLLMLWATSGKKGEGEWLEVEEWLTENKLHFHKEHFRTHGVTSVTKLRVFLASTQFEASPLYTSLPPSGQKVLQGVRESGVLYTWLKEAHMLQHYPGLVKRGIASLQALASVPDEALQAVTASDHSLTLYFTIKSRLIERSGRERAAVHRDMVRRWAQGVGAQEAGLFTWGRMFFYTALACVLAALYRHWYDVMMVYCQALDLVRQVRVPSRSDVLNAVTGKVLSHGRCYTEWGWAEPATVGASFLFTVHLYHKNGSPYTIQTNDNLRIEVRHQGADVPTSMEYIQADTDSDDSGTEPEQTQNTTSDENEIPHNAGSGDGIADPVGDPSTPKGACKVKVTMMVYKAGSYSVTVLLRGQHITGSPCSKEFLPGAICSDKCLLVNHTCIELGTSTVPLPLYIELRDQHNNTCQYTGAEGEFSLTLYEPDTGYTFTPDLTCVYHCASRRVVVRTTVGQPGVYTAELTYCGVTLKNGTFTLVVLTDKDMSTVIKSATKTCTEVYYEAKLVKGEGDKVNTDKHRKVYCYLSPRQLTIKEFYMKIFPRRLYTFRVCPFVKFKFQSIGGKSQEPVLCVDDGCQAPITLVSKDRNLIVATFANHMIKNIGGSETFKDKQDYFYSEVRKLHLKRLHSKLPLKIHRDSLLESSYKVCKDFSTSDWCRNFEITFVGEPGLDWGGVRREWFEVLCTEMFDATGCGLFSQFQQDAQGLVHPNPRRPASLRLKYYEFAGRIVGKCLYESSLGGGYRQLVKAKLTRSFLAQILGLSVHYKYFEQDDPELYTSMVRYLEENSVEGLDLTFSEDVYECGKLVKTIDLIPNGRSVPVTDGNKLTYLDALAQSRLCITVREEVESFVKGLNVLVPDNLLAMFDEYELELLLCGTGDYSVSDLKEHHTLCGRAAWFIRVVGWLWTILSGFTQPDMARFLQFVTGCSQLPPGGFKDLQPRFQISPSANYGSLPTAHTCFNQLCLPEYSSLEDMHQALTTAIHEGNQGFGLV